MSTKPFEIPLPLAGRLFVMPKPNGDILHADLQAFAERGVTQVVSLLERSEAAQLGLGQEGAICTDLGMTFQSFPIRDFGLPEAGPFAQLALELQSDIASGQAVLIHCKGGIGRSGMLASLIAGRVLGDIDQALALVSAARGVDVPDTEEQKRFVRRLHEKMERPLD